jgi:hypothetical protein
MAGRLRIVFDSADTVTVSKWTIPSAKTTTSRYAVPGDRKAVEYAQLIFDDGNTGDTISWGPRAAVIFGTINPRDVDP